MNVLEYSLLADVDWNGLSTRWILTLGHFLWEGALIGLVMAAALGLCRRASPQVRHRICLTSLLLLIPCLAVTFAWVEIEPPELTSPVRETVAISELPEDPPLVDVSRIPSTALEMPIPVEAHQSWNANNPLPQEVVSVPPQPTVEAQVPEPSPPAESTLSQMAPWIAVAYLIGVIALLFRTGLGLWGGQRLRAASERIQDSSLLAMIVRQAELVGLKTAPVVAYCNRVAVPTVIGIFKPMVLLPATLATGLEPNQLAAILSHELAHIRRYDLLVNLIQRFVESLLFFHPIVWWISRRVSLERENCCDDLAAASGFGEVQYAGALLRMAELSAQSRRSRSTVQVTALSAEGSSPSQLSRRIERLLNMHATPRLAVSRMLSLAAACIFVLSIAAVGVWAQLANNKNDTEDAIAATEDEAGQPPDKANITDDPQPVWSQPVVAPPGAWIGETGPFVLDNERVLIGKSILDLKTGEALGELKFEIEEPYVLRLSSNRRFLLVFGVFGPPLRDRRVVTFDDIPYVIQVWDLSAQKQIGSTIALEQGFAFGGNFEMDITTDGKTVVTGHSNQVVVWDVATGKKLKTAPGNIRRGVDAVAISPDRDWIAISESNSMRFWKWQTDEEPTQIGVGRSIDTLAFSPDSRYLAEGPDSRTNIQIRDLQTMQIVHKLRDDAGSSLTPRGMRFSEDGKTFFAANGCMVDETKLRIPHRLFAWDLSTGKLKRMLPTPGRYAGGMDVSPDGRYLAARLDNIDSSVVTVWDLEDKSIGSATEISQRAARNLGLDWGPESNGLRCWVSPALTVELEPYEAEFYKDVPFIVELQNVSDKPITLIGVQRNANGKPDPAFYAPHLFEFEFFDADGKPIPRTSRAFLDQPYLLNSAQSHEIVPGKTLQVELTPAAFHPPMDYRFPPGMYRVKVHYRGPDAKTLAHFQEHSPDQPRATAWRGDAVSNEIAFVVPGDASKTKPLSLVWGEAKDGLQAAVEFRAPPESEEFQEPPGTLPTNPRVSTIFHVKNVSDHTITFVSETARQGDECLTTNEAGETKRLQGAFFTGVPIVVRWTLEPGEVAELHALTAGIGLIGTPGKYTLRYGIDFRAFGSGDGTGEPDFPKPTDYQHVLYTGETPITIRSRPLSLDSISPNGEIIGRLIDPKTGDPIGRAKVSCAATINDSGNKGRVHAVTDGEGRYRLRVPSPGVYSVWLRTRASSTDGGILVEAGKITASSLQLMGNRYVLGKVVDSAGNPIENRVVTCYSPERPYAGNVESIRTKADGSFLLQVPPGRAYVHVDPKSGTPEENLFRTNRSARVHLEIPASGKIEPIMLKVLDSEQKIGDTDWVKESTAGTQIVRREGDEDVSGTVVDETGKPIEGAQVFRLDDAVSRTGNRGQFRIDTDKNTQFVMYAFAPGYQLWIGSPTSGDVLKLVLEKREMPPSVVVSAADETNEAAPLKAPPKGLEFLKPYPKLYALSLSMTEQEFLRIVQREKLEAGKTPGERTYSIETGDGYTVLVMFQNNGDKCSGIQRIGVPKVREVPENGEIVGQLLDAESGKPVAGATVACGAYINDSGKGGGTSTVTDENGLYVLKVSSPGIYNVYLKSYEKDPQKTAAADDGVLVEAKRTSVSRLSLVRGIRVKGKLIDEQGNPVEDAGISSYSAARPSSAGTIQSVRTNADGSFEFFLPPGRAYLYVNGRIKQNGQEAFRRGLSAKLYVNVPEIGELEPITLVLAQNKPEPPGSTEWLNRTTPGTAVVSQEIKQNVTGTVVDEAGKPIAGARVFRYDGPIVLTDDKGEFEVDSKRRTKFVLYAFEPGYHVWFGTPDSGDVLKIVMEPKKVPDPVTPGTGSEKQPDKNQSSSLDTDKIYWSETVTDGFRSGARLVAKAGRITAGEPLEIQYLLKNETDTAQSLDLVRSKPAFPSLEEENRIDLSLFPAHEKPQPRTLQAGEVWDDSKNRVSIDTTGFPAGTYVVSVDNFFLRPDPEDTSRKTGIPIRGSISVIVDSPISEVTKPDAPATNLNRPDDIAWGIPVAGLQVGSRFIGQSQVFDHDTEPQVQLFVRNTTKQSIDFKVLLPHPNDGWLLNVEDDNGDHVMLERTYLSLVRPQESYQLTLMPGETAPLTGVERTVNEASAKIKNATFGIAGEKPSGGFWNGGVLVSNGGQYRAIWTVSLQRPDLPGLRLRADAAALAFQVNGPELKEEDARPVTLHGFNLAPYRASKNREELQKTEPVLDRNRPHEEGGSWRCWLDSAENYNQWLVCYDPGQQRFYVVDEKSEDKIVYGPIPGDAIEKLRLLDGSSNLVAAKADEQNIARAANLHVRRIQGLLESHDISLQSHGLKAFVELGNLKTYEVRNWSERIAKFEDSDAGRDQLKPLVGAAEKYLQDQRDRIESLKVKLDDSEYKPGRQPTQAELDAEWGPVSEGLSLAIADWPRDVRKFDVNEQPQITLLVRNAGESPQRISTLDVLDGVGVIVTDEQTKLSARLDFTRFTGLARTERYLLQPGELVEIKQFSFQIKEGDLHPPGKTFNPRNLEVMYEHINVRPNRTYRLDVTLSMPSAYNSLSNGKITMPAKGEFDGQLAAKPVRLALRGEDKDQASDNTTASLSGRIVYDGEPPAPKNLDLLHDSKGNALQNPSANRKKWNSAGIPDESLLVGEKGGISKVIVWVTSKEVAGRVKAENDAPPVTIRSKVGRFEPHVLAFWNVSSLKFTNNMQEPVNLNWKPLRSTPYNVLVPSGSDYLLKVNRPERIPVPLRSDFNPWMKAYVLPLDHPFFSVTKSDGRFEIKNLPKGTWEFAIWHERVGWLKTEKYPTGKLQLEVGDAPIELGDVLVDPENFAEKTQKSNDKPKATDGPTELPDEQTPQSSAAPIKFRTIRLINGMTDRPLAGIKIRVNAAVAGKEELESTEFVSDAQGVIQIPVHNQSSPSNDQVEKKAAMVASGFEIVTEGWFQPGTHMIVIKGEATDVPEEPQVYQLWPGQIVTGRLLFPEKKPAAGVLVTVGVHINNQEWKRRLGMDLKLYSFYLGDWPNWSIRVVTKDDGTFSVTVPPEDARSWVRVGTTALGFGAIINPDDLDDRQTGRALRECIPFEVEIGGRESYVPVVTSPHLGREAEGVLNFGDLQLKAGVEVRGRVVDAEGNGLEGVHLTTQGLHGPHSGRRTRSRENGKFNFLPIEPGSLTIRPDARLRAENGQVSSRDVQAVFVDQTYPIIKGLDLVVKAVPHVELEFEWIDRRAEEAPVSYYGRFIVNGYYPIDESQRVWWRGETNLVERDGRQLLVVKVPRDLIDAKLHLSQDRIVTASYEDETGKTSGPGAIELGDVTQPIKRTIFGDEPTKQ